jgi:RNA polymerase sigma-70 factor, ECF subfamily
MAYNKMRGCKRQLGQGQEAGRGMAALLGSGEDVDWDQVYGTQLPRVYNYFRYRLGDDVTAEDLTAATFEKAWRGREQYRRDRAAFSTWLMAIARNVATDYLRRRRPTLPLDKEIRAESGSPEEHAQQADEMARLGALLARLDADERELMALKYGAGLTNRAIAGLTGLGESNVGTILHRIVRRLRAQWEEPDG